ncbi:MAG TPA: MFS transporter, partial [Rhabdochlamydiaceae bacterium]
SMFLNKELTGKFSLRSLILVGNLFAAAGIVLFLWPSNLWPYWIIIPIALVGGALSWVNLGSLLSLRASEHMQGRVMGASGSMWAIGQIVAPLVAGPLAGWNIYSPLLVGVVFILITFIYFIFAYREKTTGKKTS